MNSSPEEALFALALAKPAEKRAAWLDRECGGDSALRQRLEALLTAHEQPATELAGADASTVKAEEGIHELDEAVGQTLGRYKLLERVGEGGCGVVYVAEQSQPVRRRVALKVIKLGMDTKQVVARFEAERQALAMMDHPNIAKVLDAGTTDLGRPFFVMELVRGIKITDYSNLVGSGGLLTTAGDLLRWTASLAGATGEWGRVVTALQTPSKLRDGREIDYGLGLRITEAGGVKEISHSGSTSGYKTFLAWFPERRVSFALLGNGGPSYRSPRSPRLPTVSCLTAAGMRPLRATRPARLRATNSRTDVAAA